jgi:RNA polymerase sigma-70 factor, ECF subfamily
VESRSSIVADLYEKYARLVHRRALRFYDEHEAEEVTHEVFLLVIEKIDAFRADASPATWLYRITTNHCLNRLRNSGRRQELWRERGFEATPPAALAPAQEESLLLRRLWEELPQELLQIGIYYHVDGLTHGEIARITGLSRRTVGNRLDELSAQARSHAQDGGRS